MSSAPEIIVETKTTYSARVELEGEGRHATVSSEKPGYVMIHGRMGNVLTSDDVDKIVALRNKARELDQRIAPE